jgi:hypothetical protein
MSNTLTNLVPDLYAALDVVSRELVGMIPAVTMDARVDRAAEGQSVRVPVVPTNASSNITPAMGVPAEADQVIGNTSIVINKAKSVPFSWEGNEQVGLNSGVGYGNVRVNQIAQAMRTLVNEIEADLCGLHSTMSRAFGTAGTTPFGTSGDFTDATQALKILKDNGSPTQDNHLVVNTSAGAIFLGKQSNASVAFEPTIMNQGVFQTLSGMAIRESGQVVNFTKGAGAGYLVNNGAGYPIGATSIVVDTGTGAVLAGDVVTFAGDTNQYVVATGVTGAGTLVLAAPGLRKAVADNAAITLVNSSARNMAFNRSAIVLATRMPQRPEEGDMALDVMTIQDPRSGLAFEVSIYPGYRKIRYEIALAWGVKNIKPEHTALLLG